MLEIPFDVTFPTPPYLIHGERKRSFGFHFLPSNHSLLDVLAKKLMNSKINSVFSYNSYILVVDRYSTETLDICQIFDIVFAQNLT